MAEVTMADWEEYWSSNQLREDIIRLSEDDAEGVLWKEFLTLHKK